MRKECPSEDSLALLFEGALDELEAAAVRAHLVRCDACSQVFGLLGSASTGPHSGAGDPGQASFEPFVQALGRPAAAAVAALSDPPTPDAAQPRPGLMVGGRYRLESLLGEGGMGTVWAAEHVVTHQRFALKLIRHGQAQRPAMRRRMLREARAASAVNHPNVVRVVDVFEADGGTPVLVMDLLVGETLRQRIRRQGRLTLAETARLLVPAMAAVQSAHSAGVIHRDLKPDNLFLVARDDGGADMRVVDFGLARLTAVDAESSGLTGTGEMLGTPSYMSPEQGFGEADLDESTDVWAMGVILYECLAGKRPFDGGNFGQVLKRITTGQRPPLAVEVPGLPLEVLALVERMLTVARAERPRDLVNAIEVLSRFAGGPVEATVIRPRRRPAMAVAAMGAVVAAGALGLAVVTRTPAPRAAAATGVAAPSPAHSAVVPTQPPRAALAEVARAVGGPSPVPPATAATLALPPSPKVHPPKDPRRPAGPDKKPPAVAFPPVAAPAAPGKVVEKAPF